MHCITSKFIFIRSETRGTAQVIKDEFLALTINSFIETSLQQK